MSLLLGVVGIYGVIAYSVSQGTREIGIRIALGAVADGNRDVRAAGYAADSIGLLIGLLVSFGVMRLM